MYSWTELSSEEKLKVSRASAPCEALYLSYVKYVYKYMHIFNTYICMFVHGSGLPRWCSGKESACQCTRCKRVWTLGREDPLEEERATHSSISLEHSMDRGAWQVTVTKWVMGSQRVGHDRACTHTRMKVKSYQPHSLRQGSTSFFYRWSDSKDVPLTGVLVFSCYQHIIINSKQHPLLFLSPGFHR